MLDLRRLRQEHKEVRDALRRRNQDDAIVDEILTADTRWRDILSEVDKLRQERNKASRQVKEAGAGVDSQKLIEKVRGFKERLEKLETDTSTARKKLDALLLQVPNIPHESAPDGMDEEDNVVVRKWGEPPDFDFKPLNHWDIGEKMGILDFERGAKVAGARFTVLRGWGAKLERALFCFMLDLHSSKGYEELFPPILVNRKSMMGTGQLPKFEDDLYHCSDDMFLVPTAEVPVTNLYAGEYVENLPNYFCAFTPCFRLEAGRHGEDTRGIIRQHQFNKVELVKYSRPDNSYEELEGLTRDAESVLQELGIHYRVVNLCAGDLGFSSAKTYDIEAWMPAQKKYREISSCSNFEEFQARRANIRFRTPDGPRFIHTLNGSGLAVGRTMVAVLENYQQEDGSVVVPEKLVHYIGTKIIN